MSENYKRVLQVVMLCHFPLSDTEVGGVANHVRGLTRAISLDHDISLEIISFGVKPLRGHIDGRHLRIIRASMFYRLVPVLALLRLWIEVLSLKPDVVHVHGSNLSPYSIVATFFPLGRTKRVVTFHSYQTIELVSEHRLRQNSAMYRLRLAFERRVAQKADGIVAVSSALRLWIVRSLGADEHKVFFIPNGVEAPEPQTTGTPKDVRDAMKIAADDFVVLYAKALVPKNGPDVLVESVPIVCKTLHNLRVVIAGDGVLRQTLETRVDQLGIRDHVSFVGSIAKSRILALISAADVVVIPSVSFGDLQEATSLLMLEAMATQRPVVASAIGGLRDIIRDAVTGVLVPERDPKALARAILFVATNPLAATRIAQEAKDFVVRTCTWDRVARKTIDLYFLLCPDLSNAHRAGLTTARPVAGLPRKD